jgi:hypothetical protein
VAVARKGALRQRILPAPTNRRFHNIVAEQSSHISRRQFGAISGTQTTRSKSSDVHDDQPPGISSQDQHSLFHQQMQELDSELSSFSVGTESPPPMEDDLQSSFQTNKEIIKDKWMEDEMEDLKREREELYGFTAEEKNAWGTNASGHVHPAEWMQQIDEARQDRELKIKAAMTAIETENEGESSQYVETTNTSPTEQTSLSSKESDSNQLFTHVSASGNSISMVNVGHKVVSQRMARARTKVIFPPEVMDAFSISSNNNEMVGPKGPIFATAQLAGIMGAKYVDHMYMRFNSITLFGWPCFTRMCLTIFLSSFTMFLVGEQAI